MGARRRRSFGKVLSLLRAGGRRPGIPSHEERTPDGQPDRRTSRPDHSDSRRVACRHRDYAAGLDVVVRCVEHPQGDVPESDRSNVSGQGFAAAHLNGEASDSGTGRALTTTRDKEQRVRTSIVRAEHTSPAEEPAQRAEASLRIGTWDSERAGMTACNSMAGLRGIPVVRAALKARRPFDLVGRSGAAYRDSVRD